LFSVHDPAGITGIGGAVVILAAAAVTLAVNSAGGHPAGAGGTPKLGLAAVSTRGAVAGLLLH
jgi:hypothetical protein